MVEYNPDNLNLTRLLTAEQKEEIEELNNRYTLNRLLSIPKNVEALEIDFIHASAQIEGNTYSQADTYNLIMLGQTAGKKQFSDARMILNLREAFELILKRNYELNKSFLFDLHGTIAKGELEDTDLESVRDGEVLIQGSQYIPAAGEEYLSSELNFIFETLSSMSDPTEKAIYAHLNLAYLQFFKDGNKRTARMFQTATMMKYNLIPLLFNEDGVDGYRTSLIYYYETGDPEKYVKWFIKEYKLMFSKLIPKEPKKRTIQ